MAVSCAEGGVAVSWAAPADGARPVSHLSAGVVAPSVMGRSAAPEPGAAGEGAGMAADRAEDGEDEAQHIGAAGAVGLVAAITLERLRETDGERDATAAAAGDGDTAFATPPGLATTHRHAHETALIGLVNIDVLRISALKGRVALEVLCIS